MQADQGHQALQTFLRDLPVLYHERPGQFVAYHGAQLIGFGTQKHELYQDCLARGLELDSFVVFCIEPQETEMYFGPLLVD